MSNKKSKFIKYILLFATIVILSIFISVSSVSAQSETGVNIEIGEENEEVEDDENVSILKTFDNNSEIRKIVEHENSWIVTVYSDSNTDFTIMYDDGQWINTTKNVKIAGQTETDIIVEDIGEATAIWSGNPDDDDGVYEIRGPSQIFDQSANPIVTLFIGIFAFAVSLAIFTVNKKRKEEQKVKKVI